MNTLKKIALISFILFCIASAIGIVVAIYLNTNLFKPISYVTCSLNGYYNSDFTLAISKKDNSVQWQGTDVGRERKVEYISKSSLQMSWVSDSSENIKFTLNRLSGSFQLQPENSKAIVGNCYEATPKF